MHRKASLLIALLATTIAVAACGGTSPSNSNQTASNTSSHENTALKLAHCMRTHGVPDFPDPSGNGGGFGIQASQNGKGGSISVDGHSINVSGTAFQDAMRKCQSVMPQGPPISGAQLAKIKQGAIKMAECMRQHGVPNFPDPEIKTGPGGHGIAVRIGGPPGTGGPGAINPHSPAFQHAQKLCGGFLGKGGPTTQAAAK